MGIGNLHAPGQALRFRRPSSDHLIEMSHAIQQLSSIVLIVLIGAPVIARLAPSTALGRVSARLRDGLFRLLA